MVMVSQYRHGTGQVSLEIPGGAVDERDASPLDAAKRELREETGHEADEWFSLGTIHPNPAILDNACHLFLALGARKVGDLRLDEAEEVEVSLHPLGEVREMARVGKIRHALVVAAFHLLDLHLERNPGRPQG
jgi:8-oxo-dGTP pyrophosphatase MutT (NUDIX family)